MIYAEKNVPGASKTILFYIHYDGQPVDPAKWKQPSSFTPVMRDGRMEDGAALVRDFGAHDHFADNWRIYARSASDDKAPIVAFCAALDVLGNAAFGTSLRSNIHVVIDGEEEASTPSLPAAIPRYRDKLRANLLLVLDGPVHPSGRPTLAFGARGIVTSRFRNRSPAKSSPIMSATDRRPAMTIRSS